MPIVLLFQRMESEKFSIGATTAIFTLNIIALSCSKNLLLVKKEKYKMKKIIAILMSIILTLGFAACGKEEKSEESKSRKSKATVTYAEKELSEEAVLEEAVSEEKATAEAATEETTAKKAEATTKKTETTIKKPSVQNPTSEFLNYSNNAVDVNTVSIKPYHVYWEDGCLIAECYVINGLNTPASNIRVDSLSFENGSVKIASGGFGELSGLVVAPYSYAKWTFGFVPADVENYGADLGYIKWSVDCSYSH